MTLYSNSDLIFRNSREAFLPAKMLAFDWVNPKWKFVSGGPPFPLRFFSGDLGGPEANVAPTGKGLAICNLLSSPKKKAKLLKNLSIVGCTNLSKEMFR